MLRVAAAGFFVWVVAWGVALMCWPSSAVAQHASHARLEDEALRARVEGAIARAFPALVQINVVTVEYRGGRELKHEAAGSGAIISPEGHVITNHHVAGNARRIRVRLSTKEEVDAKLVGTDPLADIAVLQLEGEGRTQPLPLAEFGDSDRLRVGDRVLAMGCPEAISQSVTMGIVSNLEMLIPRLFWPFTFKLEGEEVGTLVRWIGHDAAIYPGNSGGPLVDLDGRIVGINEISLGLSGAIPSNLAREVAGQLMRRGRVDRSWIGVVCQPLPPGLHVENASAMRAADDRGGLIGEVIEGSPAATAGLRPGDVLRTLDGQPVQCSLAEEIQVFSEMIRRYRIGSQVELTLWRSPYRQPKRVSVELAERPRGEEEVQRYRDTTFDFEVRDITYLDRVRERWEDTVRGALVLEVQAGGWAAVAHLAEGDVVQGVNGRAVRDTAELEMAMRSVLQAKPKVFSLFVLRGAHTLFLDLAPAWPAASESHKDGSAKPARP